ncbi:hypothetical protein DRZ78_02030 [Candidatus Aerophobetes bacterium]|uniref:Uncharacterized protein n=1 Tax=Aerophobetes bacterium TaxID=2030807 RepID=A0A662D0P6_UNCAE|nr:MAG: hypothetical protein DRZ78_02030 [Candidatus Aerophobetes bacterium]
MKKEKPKVGDTISDWDEIPHFRVKWYNPATEKIETAEIAVWDVIKASTKEDFEEGAFGEIAPVEILEWKLTYIPKDDLKDIPKPIADYVKKRCKK